MAAQVAILRENLVAHPEKVYANLVYVGDEGMSKELREKRKGLKTMFSPYKGDLKAEILCWSCGWSAYEEVLASYASRIRIFHTSGNLGLWEVGSRWMIRDQPNDASLGSDFMTQEFLRNQQPSLDIPLIKEMRLLSAPTDKVAITLMSRAQGEGLDQIWNTLSLEQKSSYRGQLSNAVKVWRQFTSPVAKKVDGSLLEDCLIGHCLRPTAPTCKKIGHTTEEWFENLKEDLFRGLSRIHKTKDPSVIEGKFQELKKNFPKSEPYVLTHGDLNLSNIMVKDGKIEAIIDWEYSGYHPWWAERWLSMKVAYHPSGELFGPLWADFSGEMDEATFETEVVENILPVIRAWNGSRVDHPNSNAQWLRPGFCECKPYSGLFKWTELGNQPEHKLVEDPLIPKKED